MHLVDAEAIRRALLGSPVALTQLERGVVVAIADMDGLDREITARGLGISLDALKDRIRSRRRRVPVLQRELLAASMQGPADELVGAVAAGDADAVAGLLTGLDRQRFAALAVVLASMVADAGQGAVAEGRERVAA